LDIVRVQQQPLDATAEIERLSQADKAMGAVVSFIGTMRDINDGAAVESMTLEHYPGMTEKALMNIVSEARQRWQLGQVSVVHRVGPLLPGDNIVLVAVSSSHRGEAFDACEFIIDYLKTRAPFWKKEITADGERWVDERTSDEHAADQW
jgi:molybdopterin synthase catalytic subunit